MCAKDWHWNRVLPKMLDHRYLSTLMTLWSTREIKFIPPAQITKNVKPRFPRLFPSNNSSNSNRHGEIQSWQGPSCNSSRMVNLDHDWTLNPWTQWSMIILSFQTYKHYWALHFGLHFVNSITPFLFGSDSNMRWSTRLWASHISIPHLTRVEFSTIKDGTESHI